MGYEDDQDEIAGAPEDDASMEKALKDAIAKHLGKKPKGGDIPAVLECVPLAGLDDDGAVVIAKAA